MSKQVSVGSYYLPNYREGLLQHVLYVEIKTINRAKRVAAHDVEGVGVVHYDNQPSRQVTWAMISGELWAYGHRFSNIPYDEFEAKLMLVSGSNE